MSSDRQHELRAHVRTYALNRPGVYRMIGPSGEVLYVGKSVRVRTRLLSYFRSERGEKAAEIIGHAHGLEWDYTPSEFAALLHEFRLIKRFRPPYNVEHKRDRHLGFLKLTRERVPRLLVVGAPAFDGADYWGPFRGRTRLAEAVRFVSDLLELRDCPAATPMRLADQMPLFGAGEADRDPRCMRGQLGRCLAPCAGGCTHHDYLVRVARARDFLEGKGDSPLALLRERIALAARRLQFEHAADLRDRLASLEALQQENVALGRTVAGLSFVYRVPGLAGGEGRVYVVRRGSVRLDVPEPRTPGEEAALWARARAELERPEPDTLGLRAHEAQEVLLVARWFRLRPEELERCAPPPPPPPSCAGAAPP